MPSPSWSVFERSQVRAESVEYGKINAELRSELEVVNTDLKRLQSDYHDAIVALSAIQAENIGLSERLADRATEINTLNQLLSSEGYTSDYR